MFSYFKRNFDILLSNFCGMFVRNAFLCPDEVFEEKQTFERTIVYESFSELERKIVVLWQKNFNWLSKVRFICLEELSREDILFLKKKEFGNYC